jgi:hypothetical protein
MYYIYIRGIYIYIRCIYICIYIYIQRICLVREITAVETLIFTPQLVVKPVISHSKKVSKLIINIHSMEQSLRSNPTPHSY